MNSPEQIPDEADRDEFGEFMEGFNDGIGGDGDLSIEEMAGAARVRGLEAGREARKRAEEQAVIDFMLTGEALRISSSGPNGHGRAFVPDQASGEVGLLSRRNGKARDSNGRRSEPGGAETTTETP